VESGWSELKGEDKMPTARKTIDVDGTKVEIEVEFEVWCRRCKSGICSDTNYRRGSNNNFDSFCSDCERDIDKMEQRISELEYRAEQAEASVEKLELEVQGLEREVANHVCEVTP
jgi:predicted RNase H-like nuclease (RuvC/YqgF family)